MAETTPPKIRALKAEILRLRRELREECLLRRAVEDQLNEIRGLLRKLVAEDDEHG